MVRCYATFPSVPPDFGRSTLVSIVYRGGWRKCWFLSYSEFTGSFEQKASKLQNDCLHLCQINVQFADHCFVGLMHFLIYLKNYCLCFQGAVNICEEVETQGTPINSDNASTIGVQSTLQLSTHYW